MVSRVRVRQRGNSYVLDWRVDGRRYRRSLGDISKSKAEEMAKRLEVALLDDPTYAETKLTLREYFLTKYGPWSQRHYPASWERKLIIFEVHLLPVFGDDPMDTIGLSRVEQWVEDRLDSGAAPATVERELRSLLACLRHATRRGVLNRIPCDGVRVPVPPSDPTPHWFDRDDLSALYAAESDPIWVAVWKLVANTGMRRGEAQALTWGDVTEDFIVIRSEGESRRTKSGKTRRVPLSPGAKEALKVLRKSGRGSKVLPPITAQALSRRFSRLVKRAGVAGHFHSLRHTFITHLLNAGNPLHLVKELAGHADVHTTMRYAHTAPSHAVDAVSNLSL